VQPDGWSKSDILQLIAVVSSAFTTLLSVILTKMVKTVHVMINSRMGEMIAGAEAKGGMEERARSDLRDRAQEMRADEKHTPPVDPAPPAEQ
jgi:hypothetical protein